MPAKNIENTVTTCARPPRKWPTRVWASVIMRWVTFAAVINSPTRRKNGTASSASESMPWKSWPTIEPRLRNSPPIVRMRAPLLIDRLLDRRLLVADEAVLQPVDDLLDLEQGDQHARDRHHDGVIAERDQRGHAVAAHVETEVLPAEHDEAERDAEHDEAREHLDDGAVALAHRVHDLGQVHVVVAPRRERHADEDAPGEEAGRDLLQPKPGPADLAGADVAKHREREADDAGPAGEVEERLDPVERRPFQVPLARADEGRRQQGRTAVQLEGRVPGGRRLSRPRSGRAHLMLRTSPRIFSACGPSSLASWSWIGCAALMKPVLSTPSTTLTPSFFSRSADSFSSASAFMGSVRLTSSAAAWTHFFSSSEKLFQVLSETQMQLLLASCSVIESTGATS